MSARAPWSWPTATRPRPRRWPSSSAEELWDNRERYATKYLSIPEAMERAASHNQGPLVLADRADNPGSGAPGDSTFVLKALVDRQIGPALFGVMWDPMAFRIAEEAGEGARLRMRLGGKSGEVSGDPVDLDVTVKKIARGVRQPYGPVMVPLGDMALLSSEHVDVAICTLRTQTFHADAFKAVGADPADYRVVVVKSAQHFYNGFVGLAKEILYVASPGAADPDVTRWPYTKRKTPFWPKVADPWRISKHHSRLVRIQNPLFSRACRSRSFIEAAPAPRAWSCLRPPARPRTPRHPASRRSSAGTA